MLDETAAVRSMAEDQPAVVAPVSRPDPAAEVAWRRWRDAGPRDWYHHLVQADAHGDARALAAALVNRTFARAARREAPSSETADGLADWRALAEAVEAVATVERSTWLARLERLPAHRQGLWLLPFAPAILADGCWLQHASSALNSHLQVTAPLLRSYLSRGRRARAFATELGGRGMSLPPIASDAFVREPEIHTAMYALPAFGMAISQFPTRLLPEVLGFNLVMACDRHPLLAQMHAEHDRGLEDWLWEQAIEALEAADGEPKARVGSGMQVGRMLLAERNRVLDEMADQGWFEPPGRMARLVQRKAPVAFGYHARVPTGGESLDARFARAPHDPVGLLQWLAKSPHVAAGHPEQSRLVTSLASPRGSMAGVLAPAEIEIIRDWIRQLPDGLVAPSLEVGARREADLPESVLDDVPLPWLPIDGGEAERLADLPLRDFYFRLLHLERHPELLPHAFRFAQLWLARSGLGLDKGEQPLPFSPFCHREFADWLTARHAAQLQGHVEASASPPPTREELIASCVQLCPMVYIDGAWLQRMGQVGFRDSPVATRLQSIYLDEVGAGDARENHPNLYRELMDAMAVEMPPFGTKEFAYWTGFDDAAFRLPVMWLCLSQFPRQFMPELLGFNLAIELSGVGGSYRTSSDALRRYGYASTFVDVHNTIDNITSGHSALAFDAIRLHLDEAMDHGGPEEVQRRWKRVWTGWRAIVPPAGMVWN